MSEEEIKALAHSLGLDPKRLTLFEPYRLPIYQGQVFRFEYRNQQQIYHFSFVINDELILSDPSIPVKSYLNQGLRELAEKVGVHVQETA